MEEVKEYIKQQWKDNKAFVIIAVVVCIAVISYVTD